MDVFLLSEFDTIVEVLILPSHQNSRMFANTDRNIILFLSTKDVLDFQGQTSNHHSSLLNCCKIRQWRWSRPFCPRGVWTRYRTVSWHNLKRTDTQTGSYKIVVRMLKRIYLQCPLTRGVIWTWSISGSCLREAENQETSTYRILCVSNFWQGDVRPSVLPHVLFLNTFTVSCLLRLVRSTLWPVSPR